MTPAISARCDGPLERVLFAIAGTTGFAERVDPRARSRVRRVQGALTGGGGAVHQATLVVPEALWAMRCGMAATRRFAKDDIQRGMSVQGVATGGGKH